jgi:hypothetical protein
MTKNIAGTIANLWSTDLSARRAGATALFQEGRETAKPVIASWFTNAELARLLGAAEAVFTVGVAVEQENFLKIRRANGEPVLAEVPPDQDAQEFELHFPEDVRLDVLTPRTAGGGGAIARYLARFGEGIQQVEILCKNVDRATEVLKEAFGVEAVYPSTQPGADRTRINFFLVSSPSGNKVLIELYEMRQLTNAIKPIDRSLSG